MAKATAKMDLEIPADKVWELVADFGNTSWMPAGTKAEVTGDGPGMVRSIAAGDQTITERLESRDPETRTLVYTIPENVPFPVVDYRSTMIVTEGTSTGGAGSQLEWSCTFEPEIEEAKAVAMIEGMYGTMIGWVRDRLLQQ